MLLEADVLGGARLLHLTWDEAWNIMERAVARGQRAKERRAIAHLGVDEKAVAKRHRYVTLVNDLDRGTVEYIGDDRGKTSLDAYYQSLSEDQLAGIEAVAMDMWAPFIESTVAHVPDGQSKIVFDRFHVMKHMTDAVDQVRKEEHRLLQAGGDETLKGTKYRDCSTVTGANPRIVRREQEGSTSDPLNDDESAPNAANGSIPRLIARTEPKPPDNAATVSKYLWLFSEENLRSAPGSGSLPCVHGT